jgi:hypothetical protein
MRCALFGCCKRLICKFRCVATDTVDVNALTAEFVDKNGVLGVATDDVDGIH